VASESAKYWLSALNETKTRGVKEVSTQLKKDK
jgi:transposase-like protein